jgi:Ca-activated chloride channel homolog
MFRLISLLSTITLFLAQPTFAQDTGRTILVFDASGSMWGQIEGKAKITIAQEVLNGLLATIPADQALGLTAYGHRRKGDCSDIETLVMPNMGTRDAISKAVNAIKPRGKTPLSAAVIAAAEDLKYTEEKATVILISDGRETCDFDPCAVGAALEEAGVDFTAHVVGFDVAKKADRAQLQCLAENTGGKFLTASNATELTEALKVVAKPLPPQDVQIRFSATDGEGGPTIFSGIVWQFSNVETGEISVDMQETDTLSLKVKPGTYKAEVLRIKDEATAELIVNINKNSGASFTLALAEFKPLATLEIPDVLIAGATVPIGWTGPNENLDYLSTANAGDRGSQTITYSYTKDGQPLGLQMPAIPGTYELRYILNDTSKVLATEIVEVVPFDVSITLPDQAIAGETLSLEWLGPNYNLDYLSTANVGDRGSQTITYSYTKGGQPLGLMMPPEPGIYEVRYVLNQGNTIVFSQEIEVVPFTVAIEVLETALAGETLMLNWTGPGYNLDYISTANPGDRGGQTLTYTYTRDGTPLAVTMPAEPGEYEVRYVLNEGNTIAFRQMISVKAVSAKLSTPSTALAGETLAIDWQGPDYKLDYISVAEIGARGSQTINYTYTRQGAGLELAMPAKPGAYEIRYVLNQGNTVLASQEIDILPISASLNAPATGTAGSKILVNWSGPDYKLDYIAVAEKGARGSATLSYAYTRSGSEVELTLPETPGAYEIRYVLRQGNTVLEARVIMVE